MKKYILRNYKILEVGVRTKYKLEDTVDDMPPEDEERQYTFKAAKKLQDLGYKDGGFYIDDRVFIKPSKENLITN